MLTNIDKLTEHGCGAEKKDNICRSRGGESCAFDGAMIVLQPIADTAHIVHGPISCCGNSWEGRGTLSSKGNFHRMGFTTDMNEMDIIYGSEEKLYRAILQIYEAVKPKAIFVYATCVSGLIGEDIESVCKKAEAQFGCKVIPVNAPGFVGPKNLGNRIAGEVLLDYVIGTGEPANSAIPHINLIGEYNIAGDLWGVEPVLNAAGIRILSRITGDSTFEEITYAHRAKLNVVVCSRALINVAKEMERKYGIPYVEVSFFGKTEMSRALRLIASKLEFKIQNSKFKNNVEAIIEREEKRLDEKLKAYSHLRGKKAVLYTGGVKSWSFISALMDLGIEIVAIGTKKSTFEDEAKMIDILGEKAPLVEDVTPKNLSRLLKDRNADILVAGGRNQYLAVKDGFPFIDVNQERHTAYAGYAGLVNLAEQISNSMKFYSSQQSAISNQQEKKTEGCKLKAESCLINPLKHSQSIGAAIAFQGIHNALPIIHGAQGCTFLGKVLLTKHFREPIALASTKLFTEDVVMGSEENLVKTVEGFIEKNNPDIIGILTSGLSEIKGDDIAGAVKRFTIHDSRFTIVHVPTPDYEGGLESGYAKAITAVIESLAIDRNEAVSYQLSAKGCINVLAGSHLTPADFTELREIIESFGLKPIMLPDLSALDGSRQGFSPLAVGGAKIDEIKAMGASEFTIAIGASMESPAKILKERFGIEYQVFDSLSGLRDVDIFMELLSMLSGRPILPKYKRQRNILVDGMRDAHSCYGNKRVCIALDNDLAIQASRWIKEMGAEVTVINADSGDLFSIKGEFDLLISNSHAVDAAKGLGVPVYQMGFPVYKILGNTSRVAIGYRGTLLMVNEAANLFAKEVRS
ncbi:MAG: nitrogenase iron-molybdenum cofactor biosynthesis protein NifE [Nitrospirae bacterium]|nr:MAG: nitrogenase iron-molybdenum cofactor biosynthesis protein NifE [Nitrospirota bacterium]